NGTNYAGQGVVYSSFSLAGTSAAYTDNFLADSALDTNHWTSFASDPNGVVLVPPNAAYWIPWTLPAQGFSLFDAAVLPVPVGAWKAANPATLIKNGSVNQALVLSSGLPSPTAGYYAMISNSLSQLLVLFPGQTFTPGVAPGYSGTPTSVTGGGSCGDIVP